MQTELAAWAKNADYASDAEEILRRCVHCGFCLATCPTYQILGDELDSPRGRIYQIKQVLEGAPATHATLTHLDRCLTCRNCETTCPSGVKYGTLVDIGRQALSQRVQRPFKERLLRASLRKLLGSPFFPGLYKMGLQLRPAIPKALRSKLVPARPAKVFNPDQTQYPRQVLMLANCVQLAMMPSVDAATIRVLNALGVGTRWAATAGCCGAINFHLDDQQAALVQMRANVDAWLPLLQAGAVEAVIVNVSGCGGMIKDYAQHLKHDPDYAARAAELMPYVKDIAEFLAPMTGALKEKIDKIPARIAFHPPCTLQHWQGLRALTERLLSDLGFDLQAFNDAHLCCGAAGTYALTQPALSQELRTRKLQAIEECLPDTIASANIGCMTHLQSATAKPVRHWIEIVDEVLYV